MYYDATMNKVMLARIKRDIAYPSLISTTKYTIMILYPPYYYYYYYYLQTQTKSTYIQTKRYMMSQNNIMCFIFSSYDCYINVG